jgi:carbonic anhydrase
VNGVEPELSGKEKLMATRENVLSGWMATETALREQGLNKEANQVLEFIKSLPPVKTDHDQLKDKMLADNVRLQAALIIKTPTVDKVVTQSDDLTPAR